MNRLPAHLWHFLSLQPQACLPTESKREALIINPAKVIAVPTPICQHQHTFGFILPAPKVLASVLINERNNRFGHISVSPNPVLAFEFVYFTTNEKINGETNTKTPEPPVFVLLRLMGTAKVQLCFSSELPFSQHPQPLHSPSPTTTLTL